MYRVLGFTRHLPRHGWSCTVVCAGEEDYWVKDDSLSVPPSTEVIRVSGGSAIRSWLKAGGASGGLFASVGLARNRQQVKRLAKLQGPASPGLV